MDEVAQKREDWIRYVACLAGFTEVTDDLRARIERLCDLGYGDRTAAELIRKYIQFDAGESQP